jgi:hypothetical protein
MTTDANNPDLSQQRAVLTAWIAPAREALNFANRCEIEAAQYVAQLRSTAAGKGPRSARRKDAQNAQRFEAKVAKYVGVVRAKANAALTALNGELAALPGPDDEAH